MTTPKNELLFLALGGSNEIGMNVNLYGCQGKWVMVDLGLTFANSEYPGIDLVLPDLEFIEKRKDDLLGIVLTHGHEDHIGAVAYFAADLGVPLYATPFTATLIRGKLEEEGIADIVELNVIPMEGAFSLGPFDFKLVTLAHSILEMSACLISTPYGKIFHTGDWKLDPRPVLGTPSTQEALTAIGDSKVLAMVCDSTNVFNPETSGSEGSVKDDLLKSVKAAKGRVVVTTFASNAARLQTLSEVARESGRTLCFAGRSLHRIIEAAQANGYLKDMPKTVDMESVDSLPRKDVIVVATGGQGEARAGLPQPALVADQALRHGGGGDEEGAGDPRGRGGAMKNPAARAAPLPIPLAMVTMSGITPCVSKPQKWEPVRAKPDCTSSAMQRPPAVRTCS
jgi:ribonuclease J